jgi:hypothetical protein
MNGCDGVNLLRLPIVEALADANTVLIAGCGGGYDVFGGLPLYFALRAAGKTVHLANLSFTTLYATDGKRLGPALVRVKHDTNGVLRYFPERHLATWFKEERNEEIAIYCIDRAGARPVAAASRALVEHLGGVDAIVLVDGGTDSLMRGDETGLGTPQEDIASLNAVDLVQGVATKLLVCIGFGVDFFHGVCHAQFLDSVAALTREGAFLGAWSLLPDMAEARLYHAAAEWTHRAMFNHPSIVNSSVLAAVEGQFGNYHPTYRTQGQQLFINPLMALYWAFRLDAVVRRVLYRDVIQDTETHDDLTRVIYHWREEHADDIRPWQPLPM